MMPHSNFDLDIDRAVSIAAAHSFGNDFVSKSDDPEMVTNLSNGKLRLAPHPTWTFDLPLDWHADPFNERNWRAQLHMLRWLDPLRRTIDQFGESNVDLWISFVKSWATSSGNPKSAPGSAWINMVDALRLRTLLCGLPMVERFRPEFTQVLISLIESHARWIQDPRHLGHSNHALQQHLALFLSGEVLDRDDWRQLGVIRAKDLFIEQYDHDGINAEGSLSYHLLNYNWWTNVIKHFELSGISIPEEFNVLENVPTELAHATAPTGFFAAIGDTDNGTSRHLMDDISQYVATSGSRGNPPSETTKRYSSGYLYVRSGWGEHERAFKDETFLAIPFGSNNKVHGHPDGGSLSFTSMGVDWIVDPGKFAYNSSEMRLHLISRGAHNLITIDGKAHQQRSRAVQTRWIETPNYIDTIFDDTSYPEIEVTRRVIYSKSGEYVVVVDTVRSGGDVTARQSWQLGRDIKAVSNSRGFELQKDDARASIIYSGTKSELEMHHGETDPLRGWVSTGWNKAVPATNVSFKKSGTFFRFITVIAAGYKGKTPTVATEPTGERGVVQLLVNTGRLQERIRFTSASVDFPKSSSSLDDVHYWPDETNSSRTLLPITNRRVREEIFGEVISTKRRAWDDATPAERTAAGKLLASKFAQFTSNNGSDLGLRATLADLTSQEYRHRSTEPVSRTRFAAINWDQNESFRASGLAAPVSTFRESTCIQLPDGQCDSILTFDLGPLVLIAALNRQPGSTLTVVFHGAIDRARTQLPMFQRYRFQKELAQGPVLAFSDPTLDLNENMRLAWYLGTEQIDLPSKIAEVIQSIGASLDVSEIVLQGGSGGGFAALQVGAFLPQAHVVAMNPQTDLREYIGNFADTATRVALGAPIHTASKRYLPRISVIDRYTSRNTTLNATIVSNSGDLHHLEKHIGPVLEFADKQLTKQKVDLMTLDLGRGHVAPNNEQYAAIMNSVYRKIRS